MYGKSNPLIYVSICSTVGSVSVMAVKAFGIALKLTFAGHNQFSHPSTYVFAIVVVGCILTQMNYLNKALSQFSTSMSVKISLFFAFLFMMLTSFQSQPIVLRYVYHRHPLRILYSLPRVQYHR